MAAEFPMSGEPAPDRVPAAAWAIGWSFLAGQLIQLAVAGTQDESAWPLSMLFGVLLVVFFSYGVVRARMVRFVLVFVIVVLALLAELAALVDGGDLGEVGAVVLSGIQLGCLVWLSRTPWFAWQKTRPQGGPSLVPLMLVAVAVGLLGGIIGADTSTVEQQMNV